MVYKIGYTFMNMQVFVFVLAHGYSYLIMVTLVSNVRNVPKSCMVVHECIDVLESLLHRHNSSASVNP